MDSTLQYSKASFWKGLDSIRHFLAVVFMFSLPYTQALTVNLGFPLKVSEIMLMLLGAIYLLFNRRVSVPPFIAFGLSALFTVVTISVVVNIFYDYPYSLRAFDSRFGYVGDSITRYVYFLFALMAFFISLDLFLTDKQKYLRYWLLGAITSAIYSWYLVVFSVLKAPVFLLPGMQQPPQTIGPGIIRCGTFLEGNYSGLFMLLSGIIAFYLKRFRIGIFLFLTTITTFSTLSIVSVLIFLSYYFRQFLFRRKYLAPASIAFMISIPLLIYLFQTPFIKTYVNEKLFSDISKVDNNVAYSKADRFVTMETAVKTALGNPVFGVGLSNFSLHYDHYYSQGKLDDKMFRILRREHQKIIPNNIYVEIWAEAGTISLALFLLLLLMLMYCARFDKSHCLLPAIFCMAICFNAYPSWIMIYLWCFMAIPVAGYPKLRTR